MNDEPSPSASSLPATDIEAVPQPTPPLDHFSSQDSIAFSSTPPPPLPLPSSSLTLSQPKKTTTLKLRIGSKSQSQSQSQEPSQQQQQQQQAETAAPLKRPITISFTAPQPSQHAPIQPKKPTVDYTFPYTWEDQFIIRFPPSLVPTITEALGTDGKGSLDDILKISFYHHKNESPVKHPTHSGLFKSPRRAKVTIKVRNNDGSVNNNNNNSNNNTNNSVKQRDAILLDLPGIVESHKTVDKSQYTKVADIHQILVVFDDDENTDADERYAFYEKEDFRFPSGLTPPMRDVRPRRWDKTGGMSIPPPNVLKRQEEIEQKVQGILDADCQAEGSCFRLFDSRTGKIVLEGGNEDFLDHDDGLIGSGGGADGDIDDTQSDLKQPSDDEFAMELEDDIGGGNGNGDANVSVITGTQDDNLSEISSITAGTEASKQPLQTAHQALEVQNNLLQKIEERKKQLCSITNPMIRARLEDVIGQLEMDLQRNNQQQQQ